MHFLFLIHADEGEAAGAPPDEFATMMEAVEAFDRRITEEGRNLGSIRLQPTATAKTIRLREGKKAITDGPYIDTKEHLGGLWIIEAVDMDDALSVAKRLPTVTFASVEVRPALGLDLRQVVQAW